MSWTVERLKIAENMWADGSSATEIASVLGSVSRSAVLGEISRERARDPSKFSRRRVVAERKPIAPKPLVTIRRQGFNAKAPPEYLKPSNYKPRTVSVAALNVSLLDRADDGCTFATTDAPPHLFCGVPRQEGSAYCRDHHKLTHTAVRTVDQKEQDRRKFRTRKHLFATATVLTGADA